MKSKELKIGIITYDVPHRKTQDLVCKFLLNGYRNLYLITTPFVNRKKHIPLYQHRPSKSVGVSVKKMCENLNIGFLNKLGGLDCVVVGGAGILPKDIVNNHRVINSHPGYLPNVRGLDALKWAIYNGQPIGVTTHYIDENADEGILIDRQFVPVYFEDTFHSVAQRQYEMEIEMLVDAVGKNGGMSLKDSNYKPNRRMPHHKENIMMSRFEEIRKNSRSITYK